MVNQADLVMAMTRDTTDLVNVGYLSLLPLFKSMSLLVLLVIFQVVRYNEAKSSWLAVPIFPILMGGFLYGRSGKTQRSQQGQDEAQNEMVAHVVSCIQNIR